MRYGYSIFCDDIRTEVGEKLSLIGVYNGVLYLPELPFTLPKLCAQVAMVTNANEPFQSIKLLCLLPGEEAPLLSQQLDAAQLAEQDAVRENEEISEEAPDIVVGASLIFSPLRIKSEGLIKIHAVIDGQTAQIGALQIARR